MTIVGIDPGLATVGFGVIRYFKGKFTTLDYGTLTTKPNQPVSVRLEQVYSQANELLSKYRPDAVAIEELFFNTNVTTGIAVAQARGVLLLAAVKLGIEIYEYTPLQVKQAVVGYGRAEKKQVMELTRMLLRLDKIPRPDDAADALAIAVCHAHCSGSLYGDKQELRA